MAFALEDDKDTPDYCPYCEERECVCDEEDSEHRYQPADEIDDIDPHGNYFDNDNDFDIH